MTSIHLSDKLSKESCLDLANSEATSGPDHEPPPDSLYGWVVVLGASLMLMLAIGTTNSFGVYMQEYQHSVFPSTPASTLSWIGSLQFASMCFFGVGAGVLIEQYDPRLVGVLGGVVAGGALLIASACSSPTALIFTQGILFGAGGSCLMLPAASLPSQWMLKHRAVATGIALSGGSVGGLWMSFAVRSMVANLGWQWSLRITGLVTMAVCCPASLLLRRRIQVPKRDKIIDTEVLQNPLFVLLFFVSLFAAGGYFAPYYFMPSYAVASLQASSSWSANISSIMNGGSIAGRILVGLLADVIGPLNTLFLSLAVSTFVILAIWLPCKSLGALIAAALIYGFASGSVVSLVPVVTAKLFGIERLASILGLLFFSYTLGSLVCSPVGGALLDKYGHGTNYTPLIIYNGAFFFVATLLLGVLRLAANRSLLTNI
ncbi:hypothetical protein IWW38_000786 [Coemansia aciculifera]|uniref:Uncharacterized protein n=1 Tax=Coemansia aciculifera TaxID=417176 RepID=A0ACC1M937_9FUNG|nr:hypothetical protein IWW38_000786 [Coemansia aciculifera]